ncbi:adenosylcobinamide-GDP ribazoletransferase [Actinomarinicola tropica]|uniref:Adenosylcobinamide-GDP ribazoletransferase n=1 Tax=Actinomarinicola tropica TaxID=2789776 RepID=A0A5Q2RI98_9ACTN|nr:adenosylcobinamide-GDP ribazoletransferase [Actinomarinicola tropica]QGG95264.1 adenosylcobinamide-GDP ribazoletransferase [Actinomarinicola tropica]
MSRSLDAGGFRTAASFLTVVGRAATPTPSALGWFPVVGAAIGAGVGLAWWGADQLWPPLLAAVVAVLADLVLTGALHHDGLADSADGLLPHADRERRLAIMRQPDVGTFGVMALATTTLVRVGGFAAVDPRPLTIAGLWCGSRTAMAVIARTRPYARASGIADAFLGGSAASVGLLGAVTALALVLVGSGLPGAAALVALAAGAALVMSLAARRIGGFTGDVLGAAGLVGESAGLLVLAARW